MNILSIKPHFLEKLIEIASQYNLDFDDAYQYYLAETENLQLISFDSDFDKTDIKRKEPSDI